MAHDMTYIYSQLSAASVSHFVTLHYDLPEPLRCKFYVLGLHDNYLIESGDKKFILRVYRNNWRSRENVFFELELLSFLRERNGQVAGPVRTADGRLAFEVESPEGLRMAALFYYADGCAPEEAISVDQCTLLGRTVANVHSIAESFVTRHTRPVLDIPYLLDKSIADINPFIESDYQAYLEQLKNSLHSILPGLKKEAGVFGICHGDVNPKNFHINADKRITLFDFDQCGYGFRAFEVGKFSSSLHSHSMKCMLMSAFLDGYEQVRPLTRQEYDLIPYFEKVAVIWVMAIHAQNANRIGYKFLEKPFWDRKLTLLKELDAQKEH